MMIGPLERTKKYGFIHLYKDFSRFFEKNNMLVGGKLVVGWGRRWGTRDALEVGIREFNSL